MTRLKNPIVKIEEIHVIEKEDEILVVIIVILVVTVAEIDENDRIVVVEDTEVEVDQSIKNDQENRHQKGKKKQVKNV